MFPKLDYLVERLERSPIIGFSLGKKLHYECGTIMRIDVVCMFLFHM